MLISAEAEIFLYYYLLSLIYYLLSILYICSSSLSSLGFFADGRIKSQIVFASWLKIKGFRLVENPQSLLSILFYLLSVSSQSAKSSMLIYPPCSEIRLFYSLFLRISSILILDSLRFRAKRTARYAVHITESTIA